MTKKRIATSERSTALPTFEGPSFTESMALDPPEALTYLIYVRPRPPKQYSGLIAMSKRTMKAALAVCTIGQIIYIGDLAWKAQTADLNPQLDSVAKKLRVGDWVNYRQHAGQRLRHGAEVPSVDGFATGVEEFVLSMADTDVLGRFRDEAHASKFYDWV